MSDFEHPNDRRATEALRALADSSPLGYVLIKSGRVIYANKALCEMLEIPPDLIQGMQVHELTSRLGPGERETALDGYSRAAAGERLNGWWRYTVSRSSGSLITLSVMATAVGEGEDAVIQTIVEDITERARHEEKAQLYNEIFSNSIEPMAILSPEGAYLQQNASHQMLFRYSDNEIAGMSPAIHLGHDCFSAIMAELTTNGRFRGVVSARARNGSPIQVDVSAFPVRDSEGHVRQIVTISHDMTELIQTQAALKQSEREKQLIFDALDEHVNLYRDRGMRLAACNQAAADSLGLSKDQLIGQHCYRLWHGRDAPCEDCPVLKAFETSAAQHGIVHTPDGRTWSIRGQPVRDETGALIGAVEVTRDITAQVHAERELKEARERAEFYNDLMVHDITNIHQGVVMALELAQDTASLPPMAKDLLARAIEQLQRGIRLIANVRRFSQVEVEPIALRPVDLISTMTAVTRFVKSSFPSKEFDISVDIPQNCREVMADDFLFDALANVFHNSAKHDSSTRVAIEVTASVHGDGDFMNLRIADHGPGFDPERRDLILSRLEHGYRGTSGVGLVLVKYAMERYGGQLDITDRVVGDPTQGAVIQLRLPLARQRASAPDSTPS
ncbi:MAG: PAS domain-containing sensor histidine kinase [Candidatus Thorarchaeota archaeon]|nr:PAS domain-containing sensor histidine kinase [Candidatus Thorarchaeota archaeon]